MTTQYSNEDALFERVALELERGETHAGLWAKAFASADGDESKTKARYITFRVSELKEAEAIDLSQDIESNRIASPLLSIEKSDFSGPGGRKSNPSLPAEQGQIQADELSKLNSQSFANAKYSAGMIPKVLDIVPALGCALIVAGTFFSVAIPAWETHKTISAVKIFISVAIFFLVMLSVWLMFPKRNVGSIWVLWRRLLAKSIDVWFVGLLIGIVVLASPFDDPVVIGRILFGGILIGWFIFETEMLARFGTTPGRALLGIRVEGLSGSPNFFMRALSLLFFGLGLMLPGLSVIPQAIAYKRVRETGVALWDKDKFNVVAVRIGALRIFAAIFLLMFFLIVSIALEKSWGRKLAVPEKVSQEGGSFQKEGPKIAIGDGSSAGRELPSSPTSEEKKSSSSGEIDWEKLLTREEYLNLKLRDAHPDWKSVMQSKQFLDWVETLGCFDRYLLTDTNSADADYIHAQLNRFKRGESNGGKRINCVTKPDDSSSKASNEVKPDRRESSRLARTCSGLAAPSLEEFLVAARKDNPNMPDWAHEDYWRSTYSLQYASEQKKCRGRE